MRATIIFIILLRWTFMSLGTDIDNFYLNGKCLGEVGGGDGDSDNFGDTNKPSKACGPDRSADSGPSSLDGSGCSSGPDGNTVQYNSGPSGPDGNGPIIMPNDSRPDGSGRDVPSIISEGSSSGSSPEGSGGDGPSVIPDGIDPDKCIGEVGGGDGHDGDDVNKPSKGVCIALITMSRRI